MDERKHYRILTPEGRLSHDTFVAAAQQPETLQEGCVFVVNDVDGTQLTTHRDRLFSTIEAGEHKKVCLRCGKVLGVVEDEVQCPYDEDSPCDLLEPPDGFSPTKPCAEHSP
jgi:hypothetical protein